MKKATVADILLAAARVKFPKIVEDKLQVGGLVAPNSLNIFTARSPWPAFRVSHVRLTEHSGPIGRVWVEQIWSGNTESLIQRIPLRLLLAIEPWSLDFPTIAPESCVIRFDLDNSSDLPFTFRMDIYGARQVTEGEE
jgi:hypothetical protein